MAIGWRVKPIGRAAGGWVGLGRRGRALEAKGGHFVRCSVAIEGEPEEGQTHGLTEGLRPATSDAAAWTPAQNRVIRSDPSTPVRCTLVYCVTDGCDLSELSIFEKESNDGTHDTKSA